MIEIAQPRIKLSIIPYCNKLPTTRKTAVQNMK
jgi:hypothetical protein